MRLKGAIDDVFINCPFDKGYAPILQALIFTVYACGFRPRSARETDDGGEARLEKIFRLIDQCRYGIHDISRTQLDGNKLPRFNMPFELGLFLRQGVMEKAFTRKRSCLSSTASSIGIRNSFRIWLEPISTHTKIMCARPLSTHAIGWRPLHAAHYRAVEKSTRFSRNSRKTFQAMPEN